MRGAQPRHSLGPGSESLHRHPDMGLSTHEATNLRAWAQGRTESGLGQCSVSPHKSTSLVETPSFEKTFQSH